MDSVELMPLIMQVITNKIVIGTAVVIFLYMNFCVFVANYKKKPPKPKKAKKAPAPVAKPAAENATEATPQEEAAEKTE